MTHMRGPVCCPTFQVWEVTGQMLGLAATVAILKILEGQQSVETLLGTWVSGPSGFG